MIVFNYLAATALQLVIAMGFTAVLCTVAFFMMKSNLRQLTVSVYADLGWADSLRLMVAPTIAGHIVLVLFYQLAERFHATGFFWSTMAVSAALGLLSAFLTNHFLSDEVIHASA